jgi:hypothetical protein
MRMQSTERVYLSTLFTVLYLVLSNVPGTLNERYFINICPESGSMTL